MEKQARPLFIASILGVRCRIVLGQVAKQKTRSTGLALRVRSLLGRIRWCYAFAEYSASKNDLLSLTVGLIDRFPSCQFAGQTSPFFSKN